MFDGQSPGPTVKVSVNATVRVVLTNADTVQHDWWLVEGNERAPYIASAFKGAKTKIIESNTKEEIVFTAERVGVFKYVCTVPGHEQTMFGAFIVEGGQ
jgi:plastocyanin